MQVATTVWPIPTLLYPELDVTLFPQRWKLIPQGLKTDGTTFPETGYWSLLFVNKKVLVQCLVSPTGDEAVIQDKVPSLSACR
jgi:hypothetical protein